MPKIYTKAGDDGSTGLYGAARVRKSSLRIAAIGDIDEVNAYIGWCRTEAEERPDFDQILGFIQTRLFKPMRCIVSLPWTLKRCLSKISMQARISKCILCRWRS